MRKAILLAAFFAVMGSTAVYAQDWLIDMVRSDLRAQRTAIIEEEMEFTQQEASAFWPVYKKYEKEIKKINDQRIELVKKYADNYGSMTDSLAEQLAKKSLELDIKEAYMKKEYFRKFNRVLSARRAVKFYQIDNLIGLLIRAQVASELPFME